MGRGDGNHRQAVGIDGWQGAGWAGDIRPQIHNVHKDDLEPLIPPSPMCPQEEAREHGAVVALYRTHLLYAIQVSPLPPDSISGYLPGFIVSLHHLGFSFFCLEPASWLLGTSCALTYFLGH